MNVTSKVEDQTLKIYFGDIVHVSLSTYHEYPLTKHGWKVRGGMEFTST